MIASEARVAVGPWRAHASYEYQLSWTCMASHALSRIYRIYGFPFWVAYIQYNSWSIEAAPVCGCAAVHLEHLESRR